MAISLTPLEMVAAPLALSSCKTDDESRYFPVIPDRADGEIMALAPPQLAAWSARESSGESESGVSHSLGLENTLAALKTGH